jgi:hypothetical protein
MGFFGARSRHCPKSDRALARADAAGRHRQVERTHWSDPARRLLEICGPAFRGHRRWRSSVTQGQAIAKLTSPEYEAQLRAAQANVQNANNALTAAEAEITSRQSQLEFSKTDFARGQELIKTGYITKQSFDQRRRNYDAAAAAVTAATAQRDQAKSAIKNSEAEVERIQSIITDLTLVSPRNGRVQYLLARAGEVVAAGAPIVTILDLTDVYMTLFLPAADAGKLSIGDEARIILDPVPDYIIPAKVSFVAADAQFTPKTVETKDERTQLTFRIKLQVDPTVLQTFLQKGEDGHSRNGLPPHQRERRLARRTSGSSFPVRPKWRRRTPRRLRRQRLRLSLTQKRPKRKRLMPDDRRADRAR